MERKEGIAMNENKLLLNACKAELFGNRNTFARMMDNFFLHLIILFTSYLWFLYQTRYIGLSIILSTVLTVLISLALYLLKRIRLMRILDEKRREYGKKLALEKLITMDQASFQESLFTLINLNPEYKDIKRKGQLFTGQRKGSSFLLKAFQRAPKIEIQYTDVSEFRSEVKEHHCQWGILVTTSLFSESAIMEAEEKNDVLITLMDKDKLVELMESKNLLPDEQEIDAYMIRQLHAQQANRKRLKEEILLPQKSRSYALYGVVLSVAAFVTGLTIYYPILAMICFALSAVTFLQSQKKKKRGPSYPTPFVTKEE
jgi:hypothetical protein